MALNKITADSITDGTVIAADIADGTITTAKLASGVLPSATANSAAAYANAGFSQANTATTNAATADSKAVTAGSYANSGFSQANTGVTNAATADAKAVSAGSYANAGFSVANTASSTATSAALYANGAFTAANTKAATASPTFTGTVTMANSTITVANVTNQLSVFGIAYQNIITLSDGATITPNLAQGQNFTVTLGGSRVMANATNITAGQSGFIVVRQDGTGSRTLTFGTGWRFPGNTAPTLTTTASAVDLIAYTARDSGNLVAQAILNIT